MKKCEHNGGYIEGYICRICKKPIYSKKKAQKIDDLRELIETNPHMMDAWNGVEKYRKEHNGKLPPVTPPQEAEEWEFTLKKLINSWVKRMIGLGELNEPKRLGGWTLYECPDIEPFIKVLLQEQKEKFKEALGEGYTPEQFLQGKTPFNNMSELKGWNTLRKEVLTKIGSL